MITQDQAVKMAMQKSILRCDGQYLADDEQLTAFANACAEIGARESQARIDALEAELAKATAAGKNPSCNICGGPHPFDTVIPSVIWNRVVRDHGLPDYLCLTCIVRAFVAASESFTAEIIGATDIPTTIEIRIDSRDAKDAALVSEENTRLRARIAALEAELAKATIAGMERAASILEATPGAGAAYLKAAYIIRAEIKALSQEKKV